MKIFIQLVILLFLVFKAKSQSYELLPHNNIDTLNKIDAKGLKQGKWIVFGRHRPRSCYQMMQKVEEGRYINDRKTGAWVEYFPGGNIKTKLTYLNGRPEGPAVIYNENGKIQEEGIWENYKWITGNRSVAKK